MVVIDQRSNMKTGKIIFFNEKNRFGFIKEDETGTDYYFYIKNPIEDLNKDDVVLFDVKPSKKGPEAINVKKK
jgi:cold shock CspA family protein